jgi:glutaconate CoA-transferase subunit B
MSGGAARYNVDELLAVLMSRHIEDFDTVACGAISMLPASAILLAEATHAPNIDVIIRGSEEYGAGVGRDMHFIAQRGKMDMFFLSGVQFDGEGNLNLHVIGDPDAPDRRFPGGYGSGLLAYTAKKLMLFRTEHSTRTFVPKVDFVSAALKTDPTISRIKQQIWCFTPKAILRWDDGLERFALLSYHLGTTPAEVQAATGFDLLIPPGVAETPDPTDEELHTLRTTVKERMIESGTYARWAQTAFMPA